MTQLDIRLRRIRRNLTIASKDYGLHKVGLVRFAVLLWNIISVLSLRGI